MEAVISSGLLARLHGEAAASPTREVCGLLLGTPGARARIEAAPAAANVAPSPADGFEIDPAALFAAHRAARGGGPSLLGHYHSHPNGSPVPSPRDAAAAEPGRLWLILAGGTARLWLAGRGSSAAHATFVEVPLTVA